MTNYIIIKSTNKDSQTINMNKKINVTKPYLPCYEDFNNYIKKIWKSSILTNQGSLEKKLINELKLYLDNSKYISFVSNGTVAEQLLLKVIPKKKKILTTPFTYIATSSAAKWEGFDIKYIDIEKSSFNIDADQIESAIDEDIDTLIITHVFGNPADIKKINKIAKKYSLNVIYDASHAFGVKYSGHDINYYGDASFSSTHATKIFHTVEGGLIFLKSKKNIDKINRLKNFGHNGPYKYSDVGINAKNSEIHAAMGLCVLNDLDKIINYKKEIYLRYQSNLDSRKIIFQELNPLMTRYNYSYVPILINRKKIDNVIYTLNQNNIFPRKYFFPSLNKLKFFNKTKLNNSEFIASSILCLPSFNNLSHKDIDKISKIILKNI